MTAHKITIAELEAIAADEGVTFRPEDILIVRSGVIKWYNEHTDEAERLEFITNGSNWVGVENTEKSVEWLWNKHFAAVAGDTLGFEVWPPVQPGFSKWLHARASRPFALSVGHSNW